MRHLVVKGDNSDFHGRTLDDWGNQAWLLKSSFSENQQK
jgi:hypothetical protein